MAPTRVSCLLVRHDGGMDDAAEPAETPPDPPAADVQLSFANERTFLAWERTALGLITAGLAITQLLPSFDFAGGRRLIGLPLIGLGILIAAVSYWEWRRNQDAIRRDRPLPSSLLPLIVAIVVSVVAVFGFVLVIVEGAGS
jgi:putative membrane protein